MPFWRVDGMPRERPRLVGCVPAASPPPSAARSGSTRAGPAPGPTRPWIGSAGGSSPAAPLPPVPGVAGALEGRGALEYGKGHWRKAEELYARILSGAHPDLYLRMAEIAHHLGREAQRREWESRFLRVAGRPENEALEGPWLALYLVERGAAAGRDTALAIASREVARRPTVESWDLLSWVAFRRGELDLALQAAQESR